MENKSIESFVSAHDLHELNQGLLRQAFTHSSAGKINNERLEFLGDAVLDTILSEYLYQKLPVVRENYLTRLRAHLVNKTALAELANSLSFSKYLILGPGEKQTGGHRRDSNLADALEAVIGAVFLSCGYAAARNFVLKIYRHNLETLPSETDLKDPKTRLQEWLQMRAGPLPVYTILQESGKPHDKVFTIEGRVGDIVESAQGRSRKIAEQTVAAKILTKLTENES